MYYLIVAFFIFVYFTVLDLEKQKRISELNKVGEDLVMENEDLAVENEGLNKTAEDLTIENESLKNTLQELMCVNDKLLSEREKYNILDEKSRKYSLYAMYALCIKKTLKYNRALTRKYEQLCYRDEYHNYFYDDFYKEFKKFFEINIINNIREEIAHLVPDDAFFSDEFNFLETFSCSPNQYNKTNFNHEDHYHDYKKVATSLSKKSHYSQNDPDLKKHVVSYLDNIYSQLGRVLD